LYTEQITQRLALGAGVPPQTVNNAAVNTDGVDMGAGHSQRAFFVVTCGATVGGTVTLSLQESADNATWPANGTASPFSGSGGTNTQLTLNPPVANTEYTFECRAEDLTTGKRYVRLNVNVSANNNLLAVVSYGDEAQHKPNKLNNAAAVSTQNVVT
jgi:hypothetical protein